ncbi:hypothetical protein BU204_28155 [Actinophytocola xanthii]|uniref:Transglycosylase SLT domain-containing protein n=1 Tax=Actinophytocola xanthii TaxID=1912961 RepID=A0A1Q8CG10_9PSEU|nr:hypothetical protein BU204_28155 [Actinophytocola xanthii]
MAGYAGGDVVRTAAAKVANADSAAITEAAARLTQAVEDAGASGRQVAAGVAGLDSAWEGSSADAFVAYMGRFAAAGTDIASGMTEAATALEGVATAIDGAKRFVSTRCDQALGEIKRWLTQNPQATQQQLDDFTTDLCAEVAGDIDRHLAGTEQTLAAALATVQAAATPATRFSGLGEPDAQPFVPQPGAAVEWVPTPPAQTTPAGAERSVQPPAQSTTNTFAGNGSSAAADSGGGSSGGSSGGGGGGGGGGGYSGPMSGGPPAGGPPPGNVQEWIRQAIEILRQNGINVTEADAQRIWQIIQHESGGNPHAINDWDSNAAKGTPSKGLMQTIDPTFDAYQLPGHGDIWNPVDNILAGVNYAISRYGSLANVPGIRATESGGSYVGY